MIQKIEELSMNAIPALYTNLVNGWVVRFSNGYSKRANSVNPIYACSVDINKNIGICDGIFQKNNLDTVFKLTEMETGYRVDEILNQKGYSYEAKTNIMLKDISKAQIKEDEEKTVTIHRELRSEWFDAFVSMNKVSSKNTLTLRKMLESIVPDTYYASIRDNGKIVAVGLGVAERGYIGMYDICVHEDERRKGLGTRIMKNLIYKAVKNGCKYSYLQVVDANEGAKILYEKLGYKKQYSYWYRIKSLKAR
ncbi:GNAT family N-acetyltransferase [Wukongibacter baidiensis]|uniref:GNAT family N-acetyltransferase n=1 Tax=Wukongibacter baidiensis TaxID=1723361 RepID=UPI003D7FBA0D